MTNFDRVVEFHQAMGLPVPNSPYPGLRWVDKIDRFALRNRLILEELSEYNKAYACRNIVEIADALADLLYVVYGTAAEHGIDIDRVFEEVHRSNMTKADGHLDESGKWIKPDNYEPPNLAFILE